MHRDLQRYLLHNQLVEIIYLDRHGKTSKRRLRLLSLHVDTLRAYCYSRKANRVFRIDNILAVLPVVNRYAG